jgi:anti-anti-sigma regulatory factor
LLVSADTVDTAILLTVDGVLDSSTYLQLRDAIIKAAVDEPRAVLVDVNALEVAASSAWSVFTSARWQVSAWPDVPVVLVCADAAGRRDIARNGVTRYVPVRADVEDALDALDARTERIDRVRFELPASLASLRKARDLVAQWLAAWSRVELIPVATVIVNVFVENVLQHTQSAPVLRLESDGRTVTVAVHDESSFSAIRHEDPLRGGDRVSGLAIVAAVSRVWGSTPTSSGKAVWAVIGPENRL